MTEQPSPRILVIDDEITQRMLMKEYLEEAGFQVRLADDGRHGLKMASTIGLDLVIVDAILPGIDGYSLCAELKRGAKTADLPIILITASKEPDAITRGLTAGATDFITKPIEWQFLADRVKTVLEATEHRRRLESAAERMAAELAASRSSDHDRAEAGERARAAVDEKVARELEAAKLDVEAVKRRGEAKLVAERTEAARRQAEIIEQHTRELEAARTATRAAEAALAEERRKVAAALEQERKTQRAQADDRVAKAQLAANALLEATRKTAEQQLRAARSKADAEIAELRSIQGQRVAELERMSAEAQRTIHRAAAHAGSEASHRSTGGEARAVWSLVRQLVSEHLEQARTIYAECRRAETDGFEPRKRHEATVSAATEATALLSRLKAFEALADASAATPESRAGTSFDLVELVREVEARLAPIAADRRARFVVTIEEATLPVAGDRAGVRMAMIGLVLNALQHSLPDSEVHIEALRGASGRISLSVTDRGPGMQPALAQRLAEAATSGTPYTDLARSSRPGLGLAIAGAVARSHGGTLQLASKLGEGTTVTISVSEATVAAPSLRATG